ncbi:hypothetical protein ASG71_07850 [Arthrobacter sp. Soil763]|nr:hypothetical protein ASG71_07850 [Arthrobacter sp. Soil763]
MIGRNIILTMATVYALRQSIYYATIGPDSLSPAQSILAAEGHLLGAWSGLWGVVAVLCVVDMVNRHTRQGLSLLAGVALGWGVGYLLIWAFAGFQDFTLVNAAIGWLAPAVLIFGFVAKVSALQDIITALRDQIRAGGG